MRPDIVEAQVFYARSRRAGEDITHGIDRQKPRAPAIHARFGAVAVIIGCDDQNLHSIQQPFSLRADNFHSLLNLFAGWQQRGAIRKSPTVILGIGQFEPFRLQAFGHANDFLKPANVAAMQHHIHRQRKSQFPHHFRRLQFCRMGGRPGDPVG